MKFEKTGVIKVELNTLDVQWIQRFVSDTKLPYVEIGTRYGGSSLFARMANKDIDIYTIDPKPDWGCWKIKPEEIGINSIVGYSLDVVKIWDKPIGVLFIDGCHTGTAAKDDYYAWEKFVVKGGVIIIHDYSYQDKRFKDVFDCCNEIIKNTPYEVIFVPDKTSPTSVVILKK